MMRLKYFLFFVIISFLTTASASRLNDIVVQKTLTWNKLITEQNLVDLERMYTRSVMGYGVRSSTSKFMLAKLKFFKWAEGFTQSIVSDFTIKKCKDGQIVCEFIKQSTFKGKTKDYPSYLIFEKQDGEYLITAEGDVYSDAYNGYKLQLGAIKSVDVVALNDIRTTNLTLPIVLGGLLIILLVFLLLYYRRNHLKAKKMLSTHQNQQVNHSEKQVSNNLHTTPATEQDLKKEKGDLFEKFILRSFNSKYFTPIHWTSDKGVDGIFPISNQNPDLIMEFDILTGKYRFAVECKWRVKLSDSNEIELCRSNQLDRYKSYGKKHRMEVFIALGVGGKPEYPEKLYIIPLKYVSHPIVKLQFIEKYQKVPGSFFYYNTTTGLLN